MVEFKVVQCTVLDGSVIVLFQNQWFVLLSLHSNSSVFLSIFPRWIVMMSALLCFCFIALPLSSLTFEMSWEMLTLLLGFVRLISGHPVLHQRVSEDSSGPGEDLPSRVQPGLPRQDGGRQRFRHLWQAAVRNSEKVLRGESLFDWRESLKANANQRKTLPVQQIWEKVFLPPPEAHEWMLCRKVKERNHTFLLHLCSPLN